jgi:hypothetical protein
MLLGMSCCAFPRASTSRRSARHPALPHIEDTWQRRGRYGGLSGLGPICKGQLQQESRIFAHIAYTVNMRKHEVPNVRSVLDRNTIISHGSGSSANFLFSPPGSKRKAGSSSWGGNAFMITRGHN